MTNVGGELGAPSSRGRSARALLARPPTTCEPRGTAERQELMVPSLLSLAFSVAAFAGVDTTDAGRSVVRQALLAVEGDSIAPVHTRWSARLQRDSADRAALLGIATLARLTYDYSGSDQLYPRLFSLGSVQPDAYAAYARLGLAWSLEERGRSDAAGDEFARARRAGRAAGDWAAEAEALIGLSVPRGVTEGMAVALALLDTAGTCSSPRVTGRAR